MELRERVISLREEEMRGRTMEGGIVPRSGWSQGRGQWKQRGLVLLWKCDRF